MVGSGRRVCACGLRGGQRGSWVGREAYPSTGRPRKGSWAAQLGCSAIC